MKILVKDGVYQKVANDWIADNKVKTLGWEYSTRKSWKANIRDRKKIDVSISEIKDRKVRKSTKERKSLKRKKIYQKQTHQ